MKKTNCFIKPLLTDVYQLTMCYAYFNSNKHEEPAVFDLFFRKTPFNGEFVIFAGLSDCIRFLQDFRFTHEDIEYIRKILPNDSKEEFFDYLLTIDCSKINIFAAKEGTVVFSRVPLMIVEGPLAVCQLLETALLNLVNYASLVATNAARCRLAAGPDKQMLEFGLRRAQGPDGAISASKYAYVGGCDGTSNALAGQLFDIPVYGTHAHSYVSSFESSELNKTIRLASKDGKHLDVDFTEQVTKFLSEICESIINIASPDHVNKGELASFISYACTFPNNFLCLIDTYDVLKSGIINFCACALALHSLGYRAIGIRIDSGDLAYLSKECRRIFFRIAEKYNIPEFTRLKIVISSDLNEDTIHSLNEQKYDADCLAIGTHLVTCEKNPALGCVYKLVESNHVARLKLSENVVKFTLPGRKRAYRLYGKDGCAIVDLMLLYDDQGPQVGKTVLCRHPFLAAKRAYVTPTRVEALHNLVWNCGRLGEGYEFETLAEIRQRVFTSLTTIRQDVKRPLNPTPYKVAVDERLFNYLHQLWQSNTPVGMLE